MYPEINVKQNTLSFEILLFKNGNIWNHFELNFRWWSPMRVLGYVSKIGCLGPSILLPKSVTDCSSDAHALAAVEHA